MKNYKVLWSKEKVLLSAKQVSKMNADEIARFIRDTPYSWIMRNEDGSINRIVKQTYKAIPII